MFKSNQLKIVLLMALATTSAFVDAQTNPATETTASLQIANAFTFTEGDVLDFGVIRASQAQGTGTGVASGAGVRVLTNGAAPTELASTFDTDASSTVTVITAGTPGTYNISGAIPNTALQVLTEPSTTLDDADTGATSGSFELLVNYDDMRVSGGPNAGSLYTSGTPNLETDGAGATQLTVGGKLRITAAAIAIPTGTYTGSYSITVSY